MTPDDPLAPARGCLNGMLMGALGLIAIILAVLALTGCGTSASMTYRAGDVELAVSLHDFKDREAIQIDVQRDAATGRVTGLSLQSTNSLTSPVAAVQAQAMLEMADVMARLAAIARPGP